MIKDKIAKVLVVVAVLMIAVTLAHYGIVDRASGWTYDFFAYSGPGDPNNALRRQYRQGRRQAVNGMVDELKNVRITNPLAGGTQPSDYYNLYTKSAELGHDFAVQNRKLDAELYGLLLTSRGDQAISPKTASWQAVYCENITTGRMERCEFFEGHVVEAWGTIQNKFVKDIATGNVVPIGPRGISDDDPESSPYVPELPRFALLGRLRYMNGVYSEPFVIGPRYLVPAQGTLEVIVNSDYRDKFGRTHPEWFNEFTDQQFQIRINKHQTRTTQNQPQKVKEENKPVPTARPKPLQYAKHEEMP